jgi:hypothetical protein
LWRRRLKNARTEKITFEEILKQGREKNRTIAELERKRSRFIRNILRMVENIITTSKIKDREDKERQQEKRLSSLTKWHYRKATTELRAYTKDC